MIKYPLLTTLFCIFFASAFSQSFELDIHKHKLEDCLKMEAALGSTPVTDETKFISESGVAQPVLFQRREHDLPDLRCYYFYFQKDSTMDYVLYEWDVRNFNKDDDSIKIPDKEIDAFIEKYKRLYSLITKDYGVSKGDGILDDKSKIAEGDFRKEDTWTPNDSTKIDLYLNLSSKYERHGAVSIPCVYQIRFYVYNINGKQGQDSPGRPDDAKVKELDGTLTGFLSDVEKGDFTNARRSISARISANVTDQQLDGLRKYMESKDSLVIFFVGVQLGLDGSTNVMLQYRFATDTGTPPRELVKVLFDEKGKIVVIQPIKRN